MNIRKTLSLFCGFWDDPKSRGFMDTKNLFFITFVVIILLLNLFPIIIAQDTGEPDGRGDYLILGLELEKVLNLINGIISLILFIVTFISYKRDGRKRLLYVSIAFLLFSIKGFLASSELFISDITWIDPVSIILESLVLLFFFFGVVKKGG